MSEYYQRLSEEDKERYQRKLKVIGLLLKDDPFDPANNTKFSDNMGLWPQVEYGNIFKYFIEKPRVYTQEQLLSWKQLDSYKYFKNGYVRTAYCMTIASKSLCILKASVNPSQCTPDRPHSAQIIAKQHGDILYAHCTCKAG